VSRLYVRWPAFLRRAQGGFRKLRTTPLSFLHAQKQTHTEALVDIKALVGRNGGEKFPAVEPHVLAGRVPRGRAAGRRGASMLSISITLRKAGEWIPTNSRPRTSSDHFCVS